MFLLIFAAAFVVIGRCVVVVGGCGGDAAVFAVVAVAFAAVARKN